VLNFLLACTELNGDRAQGALFAMRPAACSNPYDNKNNNNNKGRRTHWISNVRDLSLNDDLLRVCYRHWQ